MNKLNHLTDLSDYYAISLSEQAVIALVGEQASQYLHSQVTINIETLGESQVRWAAHCDNKGKAWSVSQICRFNNALLMLVNSSAQQASLAELKKYGVFSKVEITDSTAEFKQYYVSNEVAQLTLSQTFATLPTETLQSTRNEHGLVFKSDLHDGGYYVVLTKDYSAVYEQQLKDQNIPQYSHEVFTALSIASARADIQDIGGGEFVPQMLNVQAINGIDFDKGCYMGQEVVARTRFLGKNKRAAFSFAVPQCLPIKAGDTIEKQLEDNWRRGGTVVKVAVLGNETHFMAVLPNDTTSNDNFRVSDNLNVSFSVLPLPYSIEQAASNLKRKRS